MKKIGNDTKENYHVFSAWSFMLPLLCQPLLYQSLLYQPLLLLLLLIIIVRSFYAQSYIGPMRPWQARKKKSQKIRKVEGRILYSRDGASTLAFFLITFFIEYLFFWKCLVLRFPICGSRSINPIFVFTPHEPSTLSSYPFISAPPFPSNEL